MHLDETMLQSKTAGSLVKFIDNLMILVNASCGAGELQSDYDNIKKQHAKALKRRSISCSDDRFKYIED